MATVPSRKLLKLSLRPMNEVDGFPTCYSICTHAHISFVYTDTLPSSVALNCISGAIYPLPYTQIESISACVSLARKEEDSHL